MTTKTDGSVRGYASAFSATVAAVALCFVGATPARALTGFDLGDAANYAVLYEGNGSHNLQINSSPGSFGCTINGNIGLGYGPLGTGNPQLQLNNPAVVNGNVNFAASPA